MPALLAQKWAIAQQSPKALWLAVGSLSAVVKAVVA